MNPTKIWVGVTEGEISESKGYNYFYQKIKRFDPLDNELIRTPKQKIETR